MGQEPYNQAVRRYFANPAHAADPEARYPPAVTAEASESDTGCRVLLQADLDGNVLRHLRYRVFGCPHLIAASEAVCERLEGQPAAALQTFPLAWLRDLLAVPVEKTGRLLLLEDALKALAGAIPAREPSGTAGNRRN